MKIGFVISFFDFRNDIRKVIEELRTNHDIVIFSRQMHAQTIAKHLPHGVELRIIEERKKSFRNKIVNGLYLIFKKIPSSRNNYFLMEQFKIANLANKKSERYASFILELQKYTPKFLSFDWLIRNIDCTDNTKIDDIDLFIFMTEIYHDCFFSNALKHGKNIRVYVYSWDHACKHTRFSKQVQYYVWNEGIKEDLIKLQHIPADNIHLIGSSQFAFIHSYLEKKKSMQKSYDFEYIYFGCAVGITQLASDEVHIIKILADGLLETHPEWKLVVRPYPQLQNWSLYQSIRDISNVVMDDTYKTGDLSVAEEDLYVKYEKIEHAKAFFHLGTTMGLETCLTNTPSFIVDFGYTSKKQISLHAFIHQFQNQKYLINPYSENVITSKEQLINILHNLEDSKYRVQNKNLQSQFTIQSFQEFSQKLIELVNKN